MKPIFLSIFLLVSCEQAILNNAINKDDKKGAENSKPAPFLGQKYTLNGNDYLVTYFPKNPHTGRPSISINGYQYQKSFLLNNGYFQDYLMEARAYISTNYLENTNTSTNGYWHDYSSVYVGPNYLEVCAATCDTFNKL